MNASALLGTLHAHELLLVSLIRALPPDTRSRIADEFQQQVALAEAPHPGTGHDREVTEAFHAHLRKLANVLASIS